MSNDKRRGANSKEAWALFMRDMERFLKRTGYSRKEARDYLESKYGRKKRG